MTLERVDEVNRTGNIAEFSTTDSCGQHLFSRPTNSFLCVILGQHATKTTMSGNTKFAFLHIQ